MAKYTYLIFFSLFFVFSCNNSQEKKASPESDLAKNNQSKEATPGENIGRTNYAVVWKWATDDSELVANNSPQISKELTDLWKANVVENAYFDAEAKADKFDHFPNITFFLKAQNEAKAVSILNKLTVVTKGIATYQLFPVGQLWLDRKTELINQKGITKSFVAVWTTVKSPLHGEGADNLLKQQSDSILKLWNEGIIENVYFDIKGTYKANEKTDFVFFVNANSETEAKSICEALPFFQQKLATYKLHQVGLFWMGKPEEN